MHAAVTAVLLLSAAAAQGAEVEKDTPRKPAWKWTLDERLAVRFDPEAMVAREAEIEAGQKPTFRHWRSGQGVEKEAVPMGPPPATVLIDGSKTPELFLPGELYDMLLSHVLLSRKDRTGLEASRRGFEEWAAALGFGRDFQDRLEETAAPYLKLLQNEDRQERTDRVDAVKREEENKLRICRARAQALEAAEAEFGEDAFLRLLYEGIAPNARAAQFSYDYQRKAEELRLREGGCR